jgi:LuxR family maltose regulon positive regulatory protein
MLLAGKLAVPAVPASVVVRPRLVRRLAERSAPVTVVVAGAGWGKSTLLAAWARDATEPVAWVTLEPSEDDPARFWTYVATALRPVVPAAADAALRALGVPSLDPLDVAVPTLIGGLAASDRPLTLVLDDLHEVTDPRVTDGVEFLLDHLPPPLRVVLASRSAPAVGLARLRARGRLAEVTAADLRFTAAEARSLLAAVLRVDPAGALPDLLRLTEGWAAGLVLGALALRDRAEGWAGPPGPPGQQHAVDYLLAEVLAGQAPERQELLLRTAPLERLSGPLCDAALGWSGSGTLLAGLERDGVFVTSLDADRTWYRVHPLFRAALRQRHGDPADAAAVQRRVATWFREQGQVEDAVRARLAAGDEAGAAEDLVHGATSFLASGRTGVLSQLGARLDPAVVAGSVPLQLTLAWAAGVTNRFDRAAELLDGAEERLGAGDPDPGFPGFASTAGAIAALRSVYGTAAVESPELARAAGEAAVSAETDPTLPGWVAARVALGGALLAAGRPAEALAALEAAWRAPAVRSLPVVNRLEVAGLLAWCLVQGAGHQERDAEARRVLRATVDEAAALEAGLGDAAASAVALRYAAAGVLDRRGGRLAEARRAADRSADLVAIGTHPAVAVVVLQSAAETALADGDPAAALRLLDRAREAELDAPPSPERLRQTAALEARAGSRAAATARARPAEPLTDREVSVLRALRGPLSRREVGAELRLSVNTVKGYTKSIYRKLDVGSRREAVERGRELGLC